MHSMKNVLWNVKQNSPKMTVIEFIFCKACNFTKNELLHKPLQGFFLEYQKILFPGQLFMGHSWQRVRNTPYVMKTPLYCLPHLFKILSKLSFPLPPTLTATAIFDVLFL